MTYNPNNYSNPDNLKYYNSLNASQQAGFDSLFSANVARGVDRGEAFNMAKLTYPTASAPTTTTINTTTVPKTVSSAPTTSPGTTVSNPVNYPTNTVTTTQNTAKVNPPSPVNTTSTQPTSTTQPIVPNSTSTQKPTNTPTQDSKTASILSSNNIQVDTNRANEIIAHLNEGYQNDTGVRDAINTGNWDAFKNRYNVQNPEEAKIIQAYFQSKQPKDANGIYQSLKLGQQIYNPQMLKSAEYNTAKAKFDAFSKYNGMSSDQIFSAMKNNEIGTELQRELAGNPNFIAGQEKYNQYLTVRSINDTNNAISSVFGGKATGTTDKSQQISDFFTSLFGSKGTDIVSFKDYMSKNPEIVQKSQDLNAKTAEYKKISDARDNILKEVVETYKGMPKGLQLALAAQKAEPLTDQLKSMSYDIEQLSSDLKFQTGILEKDFAYQQDLAKEQRGYAMDLYRTMQSQEFQTQQDERNFQQQIALTDYQNKLKNEGIETQIIKNDSTGQQYLINSKTGDIIQEYNTGTKTTNYDYKPIQSTDANGNLITTGYIAFNPSDPTDYKKIGVDSNGIPNTSGISNGFNTNSTDMRTDRHDNPIAVAVGTGGTNQFTKALDNAGIKWSYGDTFSNGTMQTVKFNTPQDGIEGSRAILANTNALQGWYANHTGKSVMAQYGIKNNTDFKNASKDIQNKIIAGIYSAEGGNGSLVAGISFDPAQSKKYENVLAGNYPTGIKPGSANAQKLDAEAKAWFNSQGGNNKIVLQSPSDFENIEMNTKATADQRKSKAYADRMNYAVDNLIKLESKFSKLGTAGQAYQTYSPNFLKSQDQQLLESAKQNFITASLRQESGAAISPTEFEKEEKKYFPQVGDTAETIANKQKAREFAIKAMYSQAGKDIAGNAISNYYIPKTIYKDGSYIKYDNAGNYNYVDNSGKSYGWLPIGTPVPKPKGPVNPELDSILAQYNKK